MRDEYDRFFKLALNGKQLKLHVAAHQRVQRGKGLVHQQYFRVTGQSPRYTHTLAHTARKAVTGLVFPARKPHHGYYFLRLFLALLAGDAAHLQPVGDIPHDIPWLISPKD